jgi:hypothetical protein
MSTLTIRAAFQKRLELMTALATAYENVDYVPVTGTPFQRFNLLPATPDNQVQGSSFYREQGLLQITLCYPQNKGANAVQTRAEAVKTHFKRGTTISESGLLVNVINTPTISSAFFEGDRYCIAVSIYYICDINL